MKQKVKRILSCVMTIVLVIFFLDHLADLLERKSSYLKYEPFFSQKEDFDVLFMGTSHVINGIYPMELWKDYGIVSYNFGGHCNQLATTYWVMENALDYTNPKLMVIDCYWLSSNQKTDDNYSFVHLSLDAFPISATKIAATLDLLNDAAVKDKINAGTIKDTEKRTSMGVLWDYSVYHTRWREIDASDFEPVVTIEKGAESRIAICTPNEVQMVSPDCKLEGETVGTEYLRKMIEDCKERGIEPLLITLPFPAAESEQKDANRVQDIADEYGINYINFLNMDIVDYDTDMFDASSHLNSSGARKVTDYLGQYISEHYDISDQRQNEAYSSWNDDYVKYAEWKQDKFKIPTTLDVYLILLADKNYDATIEIYDSAIWNNGYYCRLLENLGMEADFVTDLKSDQKQEADIRIVVTDRNTRNIIDDVSFQFQVQEGDYLVLRNE